MIFTFFIAYIHFNFTIYIIGSMASMHQTILIMHNFSCALSPPSVVDIRSRFTLRCAHLLTAPFPDNAPQAAPARVLTTPRRLQAQTRAIEEDTLECSLPPSPSSSSSSVVGQSPLLG